MQITKKQNEFIEAYKSGKYQIMALGGGTGSAKTLGILALINRICSKIPNIRVGVFRKSEKNHKQNTIPSFRKMLKLAGTEGVTIVNMEARYPNGSVILFNWADITKDPDCDNVKGGEYSLMFFNEANQIDRKYFEVAKTRTGRWNDVICETKGDEGFGKIKPCIFLDFNPNNTWIKAEFYDRHIEGTLPKDIFFQLSLPTDNNFLDENYHKMLSTLSLNDWKRFVEGNWEYDDNPAQLITYEMYKNCRITQEELDDMIERGDLKGDVLQAIDPADEGKDKTAFSFMRGRVFFKYEVLKINEIKAAVVAKDRIIEHNVMHTIIDDIGVGAGTANTLIPEGIPVFKFTAGERSLTAEHAKDMDEKEAYHFRNKRAEAAWWMRKDMVNGDITILHTPEVQRQLLAIDYQSDNMSIQILAKKLIKKKLGYSPDLYDCHDKETEVFTNNGWKYFKDLSYKDKVYSMDIKTQKINIYPIKEIIKQRYKGEMYLYEGDCLNFCVTPNHKMLMKKRDTTAKGKRYTYNWRLTKIKDIQYRDCYIKRLCKWEGEGFNKKIEFIDNHKINNTRFALKEYSFKIEDWLEFYGWYLSEGSVLYNKKKKTHWIQIAQNYNKNKKNCMEIESLLTRMGIKYTKLRNKETLYGYIFGSKLIAKELLKYGKYCYEKQVPEHIKKLNPKLIKIFLDAFIKGDGHITKQGQRTYYTSSKKMADDLYELILKAGNTPRLTIVNNIGRKMWIKNHWGTTRRLSYRISEYKIPTDSTMFNSKIQKIDYDNYIYCATTEPHHTLITRRNGIMMVSGNSMVMCNYLRRIYETEMVFQGVVDNLDDHVSFDEDRSAKYDF